MTPADINSQAIRGTIGLLIILALVVVTDRLTSADESPPLVAAGALEDPGHVAEPQDTPNVSVLEEAAEDRIVASEPEPGMVTTTAATEEAGALGGSPTEAAAPSYPTTATSTGPSTVPPTTSTALSTTTLTSTTTSTTATTSTSLPPTTTTTTTTSTTLPPATTTTTTTVRPSTTTTSTSLPPTTTTTSTTVRPTKITTTSTTSTTLRPTKTTTTTSTTVPPTKTTTTTVPRLALVLHELAGHDHGKPGKWEVRVRIEVWAKDHENPASPRILIRWAGDQSGYVWLTPEKDGTLDTTIGPFSAPSLTFTVQAVSLTGETDRAVLNEGPKSIVVSAPH